MVYFAPVEAIKTCWRKHRAILLGLILVLVGGTLLTVGLVLYFKYPARKGAVVSNGYECASIGRGIIDNGGSAVDAAIGVLFCEGIAMPQSMGLGGGFLMTIYTKETGKVETLNAREVAPLDAYRDMFVNASSSKGALSIAVPGELKGYWEAHKKYGVLDWAEIVQPTIDLCRNGHLVTPFLANFFASRKSQLLSSESLREIYINPETNDTYKEGEYVKREKLAVTLEQIAREGGDALYSGGNLTTLLVDDIQANGGIIRVEDFQDYQVQWAEPIAIKLPSNQILYSVPPPGSGAVLGLMLNILKDYLDVSDIQNVTNWQRIVESFKHAYGLRTRLGDPNFVEISELVANLTSETYAHGIRTLIWDNKTFTDPEYYGAIAANIEDHGTAHVSVLAPNGDAVSVTSTINFYFGSDIRSMSTGIILNDEMDDFSSPNKTNDYGLPASPANYIEPGKRPLSSMSPSIVVDANGDVVLVVGGAGGSKITTSVALVILRHLWFGEDLERAMSVKRLHHQLYPMAIQYETDFDGVVVEGLAAIGHNYTISSTDGFAALTAISKRGNEVVGVYDVRRGGNSTVFSE